MKLYYNTWVTLLSIASLVAASNLRPPVLPLTVRNPYFSTWLAKARDPPWQGWPMFYTGEAIGLSVMASIPEASSVYPLLGRPHDSLQDKHASYDVRFAEYQGAQFDAATTNLSYILKHPDAHNLSSLLTISFLSPITPSSTLRQAIPASYIRVTVEGSFDVAVYIDVNGQWVSGKRDALLTWQLDHISKGATALKSWIVQRKHEELFTETNDRAEWGSFWLTASAMVDHGCGTSALMRKEFARNASLSNITDDRYRSVMDEEPVFAFAKRFSKKLDSSALSSDKEPDSVLFTLAHIQDPVVQYASSKGLKSMQPLWTSYFKSVKGLISYHFSDFMDCSSLATKYSTQLQQDALSYGGAEYADIVALSARQVLGATSFSGSSKHPLLFLKEISSNGNSQTVDVIFPSTPFWLYTNPYWLAYLLEPLLSHQLSGQYPNNYTMHDMGAHFPNLTGHADGRDEYMPVEECGDMLIMSVALINALQAADHGEAARKQPQSVQQGIVPAASGIFALPASIAEDGQEYRTISTELAKAWISRSWPLWTRWTGYLIKYSLEPSNQLCTDDFAGELALQSNLALKGIIGIRAMSELAKRLDRQDDYHFYRNISDTYARQWQQLSISRDHQRTKLAYDWYGSWTTLYSLYADALLCFHPNRDDAASDDPSRNGDQMPMAGSESASKGANFLPHHLYQIQSRWYPNAMQKYGLPLDSRHLYTKSDWQLQAASVASPETRRQIISRIALWVNETSTDRPFSDLYITEGDGGFPGPFFFARPVVGGHFAPLVLERACGGHGADPFQEE